MKETPHQFVLKKKEILFDYKSCWWSCGVCIRGFQKTHTKKYVRPGDHITNIKSPCPVTAMGGEYVTNTPTRQPKTPNIGVNVCLFW